MSTPKIMMTSRFQSVQLSGPRQIARQTRVTQNGDTQSDTLQTNMEDGKGLLQPLHFAPPPPKTQVQETKKQHTNNHKHPASSCSFLPAGSLDGRSTSPSISLVWGEFLVLHHRPTPGVPSHVGSWTGFHCVVNVQAFEMKMDGPWLVGWSPSPLGWSTRCVYIVE